MNQQSVRCHFFIDNKAYAFRALYYVPRQGDELGFDDPSKHYTVERVYWVVPGDDDRQRVNIELKAIDA